MKLIRFGKEGQEKPGIHLEGKNYDLSAFIKDYDESFFEQNGLEKLKGIVNEEKLPLINEGQRIGSPIARPSKILCIGLNYAKHAKETGAAIPTEPILFM
ncbi:MAG: hypothetical protein RL262_1678, partial [Bacteroidota bacterium]